MRAGGELLVHRLAIHLCAGDVVDPLVAIAGPLRARKLAAGRARRVNERLAHSSCHEVAQKGRWQHRTLFA